MKRRRSSDDDISDGDDETAEGGRAKKDGATGTRQRRPKISKERARHQPGPQRGWLGNLKNRIVSLESLLVDRKRAEGGRGSSSVAPPGVSVQGDDDGAEIQQHEGPTKKEREKLRTVLDEALTRLEGLIADLGAEKNGKMSGRRGSDILDPGQGSVDVSHHFPTLEDVKNAVSGHHILNDHHDTDDSVTPDLLDLLNHEDIMQLQEAANAQQMRDPTWTLSGGETVSGTGTLDMGMNLGLDMAANGNHTLEDLLSAFQGIQPHDFLNPRQYQHFPMLHPNLLESSDGTGNGTSTLDSGDTSAVINFTRPVGIFDDCDPLPSQEVINDLLVRYFSHMWEYRFVYVGHPMMHRPTFLSTISSQNPLLLYAILAFTSPYAPDVDHRARKQYGRTFFSRCKNLVFPMLGDPSAGVWLVQALLIMAQFANCNERSFAYSLLSLTVSKTRELGLCIDSEMAYKGGKPLIQTHKWIEAEERRRTAWAVYVIDRIAAVGNSCSPFLLDREFSLSPPCTDDLWESNPEGFVALRGSPSSSTSSEESRGDSLLELYMIIGKAQLLKMWQDTKKLPTILIEFEGPLGTWHENFLAAFPSASESPFSPSFDPEVARGLLVYHFAGVIINTPFDYVSAPPSWVSSDNFRKALYHWICVRQMVQRFHGCGKWLSSFALFCIFHCALICVANIRCGGEVAAADLEIVISELEYYGAWWEIGFQLAKELRRQRNSAVNNARPLGNVL
ncbi:hypothetical protein HDU93_008657 [Gonapodya sp. JEL0774]|nr:hypothetical protein HDU93_008657 [Gonapodya sp. JEL0774]